MHNLTVATALLAIGLFVHPPLSIAASYPEALEAEITSGNLAKVKKLVESGTPAESEFENTYTSIEWAVFKDHLEIVKYLQSKGVKLVKDRKPQLLISAAKKASLPTIEFLIANGFSVNYEDEFGTTPLSALSGSQLSIPQYVNSARKPIHEDLSRSCKPQISPKAQPIAKYLIEKGALPLKQDFMGADPYYWAVCNKDIGLVYFFLTKGAQVNQSDKNGISALATLMNRSMGRPADDTARTRVLVEYLLKAGANPNLANTRGYTPIMLTDDEVIIRLLLKHGANLNHVSRDCHTAMSLAKKYLNGWGEPGKRTFDLFTSLKAQEPPKNCVPKVPQEDLASDLSRFISKGDLKAVQGIVAKGADIEYIYYFKTPLMEAAEHLQVEIVEWLLKKGANVNGKRRDGETALHFVYFRTRGVPPNPSYFPRVNKVTDLMLKYGADPNAEATDIFNYDGSTPLGRALRCGYTEAAKKLLNSKAKVNINTLLMIANFADKDILQSGMKAVPPNSIKKSEFDKMVKEIRVPAHRELLLSRVAELKLIDDIGPARCPVWKKVDFRAKSRAQHKAELSAKVAHLPKGKSGKPVLIQIGEAALEMDLSTKPDPISGLGECSGWVVHDCHKPTEGRSMDDCVSSVPICKTNTPWTESEACCPQACVDKYKAKRCGGEDQGMAWMSILDSPHCYPGMKETLVPKN